MVVGDERGEILSGVAIESDPVRNLPAMLMRAALIKFSESQAAVEVGWGTIWEDKGSQREEAEDKGSQREDHYFIWVTDFPPWEMWEDGPHR